MPKVFLDILDILTETNDKLDLKRRGLNKTGYKGGNLENISKEPSIHPVSENNLARRCVGQMGHDDNRKK